MSPNDGSQAERLQELLRALVAKRMEESLRRVETAIGAWRQGQADVFFVHAEVVQHAERANVLSTRVARAGIDGPQALLRDAFDAGIIEREEFGVLTGLTPEEVPAPASLDEEGRKDGPFMPDKRGVLGKLLEDGAVLIHLDARREGVKVPLAHKEDPRLVLRLGFSLSPPIPDLLIDDDGVSATLTFRGTYFGCKLPWSAIYAIVSEDSRGLIWPEDVPSEVAKDFARQPHDVLGKDSPPEQPPPSSTPRRGHLKLV